MEKQVYRLIESYARGLCDTDCFTGEITALCCTGSVLEGISADEALLIEELCAGAQRFSGEEDAFPSTDLLDEMQFRTFFSRLYPELKRRMPYEVWKEFA